MKENEVDIDSYCVVPDCWEFADYTIAGIGALCVDHQKSWLSGTLDTKKKVSKERKK